MSIGNPFPVPIPSFEEFKRDAQLGRTAHLCCLTEADLQLMLEIHQHGASPEQFEQIVAVACCQPGPQPHTVDPNPGPAPQPQPQLSCIDRMAALACDPTVQHFLRQLVVMIEAAEKSPFSAFSANDKIALRALATAINALLTLCARPHGPAELTAALAVCCGAIRTVGQLAGSAVNPATAGVLRSIMSVLTFGSPLTAIMKECC